MLQVQQYGPVMAYRLSRSLFGRPLRWAYAYLIDGLLIDTGPPATARELVAALQRQRLTQVLNTHHHEDHFGASALLQRTYGMPPMAPAMVAPLLAAPPRIEFYRRVVWGRPEPVVACAVEDSRVATDHHSFQMVHAPGHSGDHHILFEPQQRWLFAADLYLAERAKYLRRGEDLGQLMASLGLAARLAPEVLFCAHAGPVLDGTAALQRKISYWEDVIASAHSLRSQGLSPERIRDCLLGPEGTMTRISRGHFSKLNLVRAALALTPAVRN
jgi:glyoxylase-like metal-dependent hydrolase (beta-lactamase superfamily II)